MRKLYLIALSMAIFVGLNAQEKVEITGVQQVEAISIPSFSASKTAGTVDTLDQYLNRATAFFSLTAGSSGYVLGTGPTIETFQHFDLLGTSTTVTEVFVYFNHKEVMGGTADSMYIVIAAADADSTPLSGSNQILYQKFSVDDVDTSGLPTFFNISSAISVTSANGFLVGVNYQDDPHDDTLVILSSNPTMQIGGPDGQGERRCRQKLTNGFIAAADYWTIAGGPYDADAMIIPIVDYETATGIYPGQQSRGLSLFPSYPNPAQSRVMIPFETTMAGKVKLEIYNSLGKQIKIPFDNEMQAGAHELSVDLAGLSNGKYYFILHAGNGFLGGKFTVLN